MKKYGYLLTSWEGRIRALEHTGPHFYEPAHSTEEVTLYSVNSDDCPPIVSIDPNCWCQIPTRFEESISKYPLLVASHPGPYLRCTCVREIPVPTKQSCVTGLLNEVMDNHAKYYGSLRGTDIIRICTNLGKDKICHAG